MLNTLKCAEQKPLWQCPKQDQRQLREYKQVIENIISENSAAREV
jgi:hypothetical protein